MDIVVLSTAKLLHTVNYYFLNKNITNNRTQDFQFLLRSTYFISNIPTATIFVQGKNKKAIFIIWICFKLKEKIQIKIIIILLPIYVSNYISKICLEVKLCPLAVWRFYCKLYVFCERFFTKFCLADGQFNGLHI